MPDVNELFVLLRDGRGVATGHARMQTGELPIFDLAEKRLAWADQRQQILSENIANADTPGWRSQDVSPFASKLAALSPVQTDAGHLPGLGGAGGKAVEIPGTAGPDGNGVALDTELSKVADTEATHDLVDDLYKKYLGLFKTVIGR
jgi:flagellar basal-body rod protein FlgB